MGNIFARAQTQSPMLSEFGLPAATQPAPSSKEVISPINPEFEADLSTAYLSRVLEIRGIPENMSAVNINDGIIDIYTSPDMNPEIEVMAIRNGHRLILESPEEQVEGVPPRGNLVEGYRKFNQHGKPLKYSEIWVKYPPFNNPDLLKHGWIRIEFDETEAIRTDFLAQTDYSRAREALSQQRHVERRTFVKGAIAGALGAGAAILMPQLGETIVTAGKKEYTYTEIENNLEAAGLGKMIPLFNQLRTIQAETGVSWQEFRRFMPIVEEVADLINHIDEPTYLRAYKEHFAEVPPSDREVRELVTTKTDQLAIHSNEAETTQADVEYFRGSLAALGQSYWHLILGSPHEINIQNSYSEYESPHYLTLPGNIQGDSTGRITTPFSVATEADFLRSMSTAFHELGHAFDFCNSHINMRTHGDVRSLMTFNDYMDFYGGKTQRMLEFYNRWIRDGGSAISHEKLINTWAFNDYGSSKTERQAAMDSQASDLLKNYPQSRWGTPSIYACTISDSDTSMQDIYNIAARAKTIAEKPEQKRSERERAFLDDPATQRITATVLNHIFHLQLQFGDFIGEIGTLQDSLSSNPYTASTQEAFHHMSATWGMGFDTEGTSSASYASQAREKLLEHYRTVIQPQLIQAGQPLPGDIPEPIATPDLQIETMSPQLEQLFDSFGIWQTYEQEYTATDISSGATEQRKASIHQIPNSHSCYIHFSKPTSMNMKGRNVLTMRPTNFTLQGLLVNGFDSNYQSALSLINDIIDGRTIDEDALLNAGITLSHVVEEPTAMQSMMHGTYLEGIRDGRRFVALENFPPLATDNSVLAQAEAGSTQVQVLRFLSAYQSTAGNHNDTALNLVKVLETNQKNSFPAARNKRIGDTHAEMYDAEDGGGIKHFSQELNNAEGTVSFAWPDVRITLTPNGSMPIRQYIATLPFNLAIESFEIEEQYHTPSNGTTSIIKYYLNLKVKEEIDGVTVIVPYKLEIGAIDYIDPGLG